MPTLPPEKLPPPTMAAVADCSDRAPPMVGSAGRALSIAVI